LFVVKTGSKIALNLWGYLRAAREGIKGEHPAYAAERVDSLTNAIPQESCALIQKVVDQKFSSSKNHQPVEQREQ
jgi:hypothetical protein